MNFRVDELFEQVWYLNYPGAQITPVPKLPWFTIPYHYHEHVDIFKNSKIIMETEPAREWLETKWLPSPRVLQYVYTPTTHTHKLLTGKILQGILKLCKLFVLLRD